MAIERQHRLAERLVEWRRRFQRAVGERLKEERRRLGMSKVEFAKRIGVHRNTQTNYESGEREPDAAYLEAAEQIGVSLSYVLEGERAEGLPHFAAQLAGTIFKKGALFCKLEPEAMEELFFLLGLDEVRGMSNAEGQTMDSAQKEALIQEAFRRGDVFAEAAIAISNYGTKLSEELSPKLRATLILQTLELYDTNRDKLRLTLRDNIRLVAEDVVARALDAR